MVTDLKARWEALSANTKRVIILAGAFGFIMFLSFLTTLLEEDKPKLDRLDTTVDVEMMLPERRDATLDELNASQIAAARRIARIEQNLKTNQKAIQDALRDLQGQLNADREPQSLRSLKDQVDYLTRQLRRVETTAQRTQKRTDELLSDEPAPDVVGPEAVPDGPPDRVVAMPGMPPIPGADSGEAPPDIPDIPNLPGQPQVGDGGEKPGVPDLPKLPDLPGIPSLPGAQQGETAAAGPVRPTMRMVTASGETNARGAGGGPQGSGATSSDQGTADQMRIPPSSRVPPDAGGRGAQERLATPARPGGGGNIARTDADRREEARRSNNVSVYMPSGAMFSGVLLNGVDALTSNTASSSPAPVLIRVQREAIVPNHFTVDVRECFVIASGFGRLSTERVEARTERLSCVRSDGGVIDTKLEGYIIGEDGKVGMRGRLVSRYGAMLTRSGIAGLLSGFSEALQPEFVNQLQIDPTGDKLSSQAKPGDVVKGGLYGGVSSTSKEISQFFLDMARETLPTLEVDAGRRATIVILRGTSLELG